MMNIYLISKRVSDNAIISHPKYALVSVRYIVSLQTRAVHNVKKTVK